MSHPRKRPGTNLTICMSATWRERLELLQEKLEAPTLTEAIRRATDIVLALKQKGAVILLKTGEAMGETMNDLKNLFNIPFFIPPWRDKVSKREQLPQSNDYTITYNPVSIEITQEELEDIEWEAQQRKQEEEEIAKKIAQLRQPIFVDDGNIYFCTEKFINECAQREREFYRKVRILPPSKRKPKP